jgi:hypothetical protein
MGNQLIEQAGLGIARCDCCTASSSAQQRCAEDRSNLLAWIRRVAHLASAFEERPHVPAIELTGDFLGRLQLGFCSGHVRTGQQNSRMPDGQKAASVIVLRRFSSRSYPNRALAPLFHERALEVGVILA